MEVKAASGFNFLPLQLNTRNPNIKSIRDLTDKDKIALPAVKVSMQAIILQMAAAQAFGEANYTKLDGLTVSMAHPDAMAALLSGAGEINNHFTSPPFMQKELEKPGITQGAQLGRRARRADLVQRRRRDEQVLQREPEALRRVHAVAAGSDRIHQQGQARRRRNLHQA